MTSTSRSSKDCEIHPSLSSFLYGIVLLIPFGIFILGASLTPQDGSIGQTTTLIAIAFLLPLVLLSLILSGQSRLKKGSFARIEGGTMTLKHKDNTQEWQLNELESIHLNPKFGFATDWKIKTKTEEIMSFNMGGMISSQDEQLFRKCLEKHNISMV